MEFASWLNCQNCFTLGNVLLAFLFFLILNQLIELYQFRNMPPGPRFTSIPFIGNLLSFDNTAPGGSFLDSTASLRKKYGPVFSLKAGSFKLVVATDPDSVKEVLVKKSGDYSGRPPLNSFQLLTKGGKDIAFADYGPAWRFHRKVFMSALRQYLSDQQLTEEVISQQTEKLLTYFEEQNGKDFDPNWILTECVADVICRITFGKNFESSHPECQRLLKLHVDVSADTKVIEQVSVLDLFPIAKYLPFRGYRILREFNDGVLKILANQLREKERSFDPSAVIESLTESLLKERLAAANEEGMNDKAALLSDDYILNSMEDMFSAGYETTSTTLRWALAYLVHHPECQKEIQDQLDEVVGRDRMPGLDDRSNLPLLNATVMETQRLGNVVESAIPHCTIKETTLAGYRVPKDTIVFVSLQAVHQDPKCWEDPMMFNPHRHIDSNGKLITGSGNFLPFSAGRRVCAGETLAKVELFLFLSWMLHKFTLMPASDGVMPDLKGVSAYLTRSPGAYKVRAVNRH